VLPGLGLALADPDEDAMTAPPRRQGEPVIPREDMARMLEDSATIAASTLVSHLVGLARFGPGPETRGMTFLSLSLGQLFYTLTSQQTDIRKLEPGRLLENRMLDSALLTSITAAVLPFFVPRLRRLLGIAPLDAASSAVALAAAVAPAASVLARRGISLQLETVEGRVCETS
jgi:Ca2+-transporting ATPase